MTKQTRRQFLARTGRGAAAVVSAPLLIPSLVIAAPSNRITLGFIGMGGQGMGRNLGSLIREDDVQVLAICDVDPDRRRRGCNSVNSKYGNEDCAIYRDFREVLARPDIDAIVISTPDHWHCLMSVMAIRAGKDVLCEKPTLTIQEGRILSDTVQRYGAVYQTGVEDRSLAAYHRMAERVRNGRIGNLQRISLQLPGGYPKGVPLKQQEPEPVPDDYDYDLWLGPAPYAPYCRGRCHWNFRWIRDYSGGQLTDWGAHIINVAQWANNADETGPVSIEGRGEFPENTGIYNTAHSYHIEYEYANGVHLTVQSGGTGLRFEGTDGWIGNRSFGRTPEASSNEILNSPIEPEEEHLYTDYRGEHRNFLDCIKSRRTPFDPAESQHRYSTVAHLGNISMQLGRKLRWDPSKEEFIGDESANALRSRSMREPWYF